MNVQSTNVSATRKSFVVTLDQSEVDAEHKAVVGEIAKFASIPGFRPGKVPAAMVAKRFSREIENEFKQKVVGKAYQSALAQEKLDVINVVDVKEDTTIAAGQPATISITVDIRPEFTLPEYTGLPTEVVPVETTDAEVDNLIQGLRSERADFKPADRPAQKGDYVKLGYEGTVDDKPVADLAGDKQLYAKVPQTWEEVEGTNEGVIPGLGAQLAGVKAGDKKTVSITFPAEFAALPALAGKTVSYALDIQEVRERVLPPLDEEFFKANGAENLESLKTNVAARLKSQKEFQNRNAQRQQVTAALAAKVDFPIPDSLVESETQGVLRNFIEENMRRGVPEAQFEKDKNELYAGARNAAQNRVKVQLLLAKVAEAEKLQVTESDIDTFIYRESMRTGQKPDKLVKTLAGNQQQLRAVQQSIIFDKAVDFLVSKATVATVQPKAQ